MFTILFREINAFLSSLIAYIVITVFLTAMGLIVWVFPDTNVLDYGFADLHTLFFFAPYVFMFLIPAITMRTFAEEKKTGTIELLLTRPVKEWNIILGKYFSSWLLVIFALLPTLIYYFTIYYLSLVRIKSPEGTLILTENMDSSGIAGSYIGLLLLGAVFTAIGIFASSISRDQIISFITAVFLCFILYLGFSSIAAIDDTTPFAYFIAQLGIDYHYNSVSKGLIDSRNLVYFVSVVIVMLSATKLVLDSRKW
ncbi:MAG: gliding motility-associated ABC transporter permease subunit GldF [Thermonemataceae bacterium]